MNNIIKYAIGGVVLVVVSGAVGRFTAPSKVVEKEVIKYQDRIVEKIVKDTDTKKNNDKVLVKTETIKPDGTKIVETKLVDKSTTETVKNSTTNSDKESSTETSKEKTTEYKKDSILISLGVKTNLDNFPNLSYGIMVNKRILGPVYAGAFGFTDKTVGLNLGISF